MLIISRGKIKNEVLTKTHVLESAKNGQLLQNTTFLHGYLLRNIKVLKAQNLTKHYRTKTCTTVFQGKLLGNDKVLKANNGTITARITAFWWYLKSDVRLVHNTKKQPIATVKPSKNYLTKICTTALLVSLLATCTSPSYAIASHYQPTNNDSFILVDMVAVSGNNGRQERRNLLKPVQHHTIVDVFLCLPFISLLFMGELRLAIAFIALWWGGYRNKPFIRRILCAVGFTVSNLPAALHLGQIIKTSSPLEKV